MSIDPQQAAEFLKPTYAQMQTNSEMLCKEQALMEKKNQEKSAQLVADAGKELFASEAEKSNVELAIEYGGMSGTPEELEQRAEEAARNLIEKEVGVAEAEKWIGRTGIAMFVIAGLELTAAAVFDATGHLNALRQQSELGSAAALLGGLLGAVASFAAPPIMALKNRLRATTAEEKASSAYDMALAQQTAMPRMVAAVDALRQGDGAALVAESQEPGESKRGLLSEAQHILQQTQIDPERRPYNGKWQGYSQWCLNYQEPERDKVRATVRQKALANS